MRFIGVNRTRYSTEDLEGLVNAIYQLALVDTPGDFGARWANWDFRFTSEELLVDLAYWPGRKGDRVTGTRSIRTGNLTSPQHVVFPGPWFVKQLEPGWIGRNLGVERPGWRCRLLVLSPQRLQESLPPIEALGMAADEAPLPLAATAQLLHALLVRGGLRLGKMSTRRGPPMRMVHHSDSELYCLLRVYLEQHPEESVRVMKNIQTKRPKPSTVETIRRLLELYLTGGAAQGLSHKRWTVADRAEHHHQHWLKAEKQRMRLRERGGAVPSGQLHLSTGDMLRTLADEYDRRMAQRETEE